MAQSARLCPEPNANSILPHGRPGEEYTKHNQDGSKLAEDGGSYLVTLNPLHLRQQDPRWAHRTSTSAPWVSTHTKRALGCCPSCGL